ncbi:MAG: site-2 protease family protein [Clostridia bacterium]|nr:site-2 protease family protein [Clostridia bacterium]
MQILIYVLSSLTVIFLTLPIHEFAHGWAAVKLGDNTPRWQGRLTLNPFAHIDYIGAVCILFFGFGWARPVQVNQNSFRNPKRDMALTALAGPVSNIIVAFIALVLANALQLAVLKSGLSFLYYVFFFFCYIAEINVYLAVFNLIPIPPLDGSRLLSALLPYKYYYALMRYERYIFWGLLALLWVGVLDIPLDFLSDKVMSAISFLANLPFSFIL